MSSGACSTRARLPPAASGVDRPARREMLALYSKTHIRAALNLAPSPPVEEELHWLVGAPPEVVARVRAALPKRRTPAAVLVPLVERATGLTVLLTERAATLKE